MRMAEANYGASRYTRSRRPIKLVWQETQPTQSSALKREAATKTMTRREKMAMIRSRRKPTKARQDIARLEDIPNIGPAVAGDLRRLGINVPANLRERDPYAMYDVLFRITGQRHDPCLLDTFIAAVRFMAGEPKKPWWKYTAERKKVLAARSKGSK